MWYQQMFVCAIYTLLGQTNADSNSRFNGGTSGQQQQQQQQFNSEQQQLQVNLNAWQPLTGHNNWLILQATAATTMQRQQDQQHRLPVNYYAYNHRYNPRSASPNDAVVAAANGNYKQVLPNLNDSPSYVLAISQTMRRGGGQVESDTEDGDGVQRLQGVKNAPEVEMRAEPEVRDTNDLVALTKAVVDDDDNVAGGIQKASAPVLDISNYLAPFEQAVLKVRNFCDTLQSLITVDDGDLESEDEAEQLLLPDAAAAASSTASKLDARSRETNSATTSKEVQGRDNRLASTYQSRKIKKIKKKIQKLFLPLLIAYKLKFLTLIPVLIGGLTLLVGTTGLAGFFFALFTAVMSLKTSTGGHSSKTLVLKKL